MTRPLQPVRVTALLVYHLHSYTSGDGEDQGERRRFRNQGLAAHRYSYFAFPCAPSSRVSDNDNKSDDDNKRVEAVRIRGWRRPCLVGLRPWCGRATCRRARFTASDPPPKASSGRCILDIPNWHELLRIGRSLDAELGPALAGATTCRRKPQPQFLGKRKREGYANFCACSFFRSKMLLRAPELTGYDLEPARG
jgi:hypothetical protein